ncbi:MAG TPA: hypothetical protein VGM86_11955 [Thermoanaerobaculia bacterium]|jgi:hypothetical protein
MIRRVATALFLLALLTSCSSKDLTRPRVADLIKANAEFAKPVVALPLQEEGKIQDNHDAGQVEGIWNVTRSFGEATRYTLTANGRKYFAQDFTAIESAPLAQAAKRELIEVTGITSPPQGGESLKIATFTWHYAGLPELVARYTGEEGVTHNGEAAFQLFDDGWRLQDLALHEHQNLAAFRWSPELQQQLYSQLAALRLKPDHGLELAKAALVDREPVLNFSFHPAWNIPTAHGLTGQALNTDKLKTFMALLGRYHIDTTGAGQPSPGTAYYEVPALSPPSGWESFERKPRYTDGKSYAVFQTSEVRMIKFVDLDTENANAEVEVTYSGCTPACELANALEALPNFDYGGRAVEKVFYGYPAQKWPQKVSSTVYFQRPSEGAWKVSDIR